MTELKERPWVYEQPTLSTQDRREDAHRRHRVCALSHNRKGWEAGLPSGRAPGGNLSHQACFRAVLGSTSKSTYPSSCGNRTGGPFRVSAGLFTVCPRDAPTCQVQDSNTAGAETESRVDQTLQQIQISTISRRPMCRLAQAPCSWTSGNKRLRPPAGLMSVTPSCSP